MPSRTQHHSASQLLLKVVEHIRQNPNRFLVKSKPHRQVYIIEADERIGNEMPIASLATTGIVVKHFTPIPLRHKVRAFLSLYPPAAREYSISRTLIEKSIPTAKPLHWFRSKNRLETWFAAELLPSRLTLEEYFAAISSTQRTSIVFQQYAELLADLHRVGIYVDDFGPHNVIIDTQTDSSRLWLIDHEATRRNAGYFLPWRKKNILSALRDNTAHSFTANEIDLFLKSYEKRLVRDKTRASSVGKLLSSAREAL